ncbi:hypothetical protein TI04_10970, partial [Achromatium sp. WMS2]
EEHELILYTEYPFPSPQGTTLRADGALIDRVRLVHGWWEAKDEKDNLEREIELKISKGYPIDNIIFEDTSTAILIQNGQQVLRCTLSNPEQLQRLLTCFFEYEIPIVEQFRHAKEKFAQEIPKVAAALTDLLAIAKQIETLITKAEIIPTTIAEFITSLKTAMLIARNSVNLS